MKIKGYFLKKERSTGAYWSDISGTYKQEDSYYIEQLYSLGLRQNKTPHVLKMIDKYIALYIEEQFKNGNIALNVNRETVADEVLQNDEFNSTEIKQLAQSVANNTIQFFSEFEFEPNFRFMNTLAKTALFLNDAIEYVKNYFALTNSPHQFNVAEKLKSQEFSLIVSNLQKIKTTNSINSRFQVYYGAQGTGKTTAAMKLTDSIMVCHSAMLPQDLMEDFKFEDGKATFKPSALQIAMVEGKKITLDEINLLPFESLRFLQSLLDNKQKFDYKGKQIVIKNGFEVYGTMNLTVNGSVYALPEPLVDRASKLKEYTLTAESLMGALI